MPACLSRGADELHLFVRRGRRLSSVVGHFYLVCWGASWVWGAVKGVLGFLVSRARTYRGFELPSHLVSTHSSDFLFWRWVAEAIFDLAEADLARLSVRPEDGPYQGA